MAVALVTGASSGIGLATAVTLARGGHTVIATMRNLNGAGELRKIVSEEKLPVEVAALNVDEDASVSAAIGKALVERGHIDVLVNNAGIGGGGAVEEVPMDFFRQMMETNFFGALRCMKAVIPSMRERRQGGSVATILAHDARGAGASSARLTALSHCEIKIVTRLPSRRFQAAATASRHVVIAAVRSTRCV
jgi:NAD(P)-dependent dehydrogenase (short-subunit alcohol dehydrogenase family)